MNLIHLGLPPYRLQLLSFLDLALALYSRISKIAAEYIRVGAITDRYFNNNLIEGTGGARDNEGKKFGEISDHYEILSNFQKDSIRNSSNKDTLYQYLTERFIGLYSSASQILVITYKDAILKTQDVPDESINWYKYGEADARVIRHLINVSKCRMFDTIVVYSSDADVLLLCLAYYHRCEFHRSTCTVFCKIGMGSWFEDLQRQCKSPSH